MKEQKKKLGRRRVYGMSNDPNIDPGGQSLEASSVDAFFPDHGQPGPSTDVVTQPQGPFPQYMVTDDNMWIQPLTDQVYEDEYGNYHEIHDIEQQPDHIEEVYLLPDEERDIEMMRNGVGSLQVAAHEVVVDEMLGTSVEPEQYMQQVPTQVVRGFPQQYVQTVPRHVVRPSQPQTIMSNAGQNRVRYIVQHTSQTVEVQQSQSVYEMRPMAMFEGPSNQALIPHQQQQVSRPVPSMRSRSKSQPRRPLYGELEDESLAYLVQEHDENEWDGVQLEDHEYFVGGQQEREAILNSNEDELAQSAVPPPKTIQRPYFPPNLSPTEKKEYLFVNYKKACDRYFPFANVAVLEADTRYKPVEAFASDLYRFHSRGAHIHGFFRTVIDVRDRPSHDQTRYIQDIQFGKVFPLFPDYDEWDDKMRDEFRQLSNRLMRIFERKCFYAQSGGTHGKAPVIRPGPKSNPKPPPDYAEQQRVQVTGIPKGFHPVRASYTQTKPGPTKHSLPAVAAVVHPASSSTRLTPLDDDTALNEPVPVPQDVGASRVEAFEHNRRVGIKRIVNEAFGNREPASSQYQEQQSFGSSDPRSYVCRVPPGPSKTLRHQRSIASKAIRMIANRTIEPVFDPATGRYVVPLEGLRSQGITTLPPVETTRRYIPRPVHTLREMADSARRGPSASVRPIWSAAGRPQGARVSRIDQAPRFTYNSSGAAVPQHQPQPSSSAGTRAPLLKNAATAQVPRRPGVHMGNTVAAPAVTRNDHVYPRSHSSGRTAPSSNNYRRSASSGRPASGQAKDDADDGLEEFIQVDDEPIVVDASQNQDLVPASMGDHAPTTFTQEMQPQLPDQNTAPASAKGSSDSRVIPFNEQRVEKRYVQVRDEHGFLRRCLRLPDGTLVAKNRKTKSYSRICVPQSGTEARSAASQEHNRTPTAGAVYAIHSMGRKDEKRPIKQTEQQWKRSQASVAPWSHTAAVVPQRQDPPRHVPNELPYENRSEQPTKGRTKRKDALYSDDDDDIVVISERLQDKKPRSQSRRSRKSVKEQDPGVVVARKSRSRTPKQLSRICGVPQTPKTDEQRRESLRRRLAKQEEEDSENIVVDVLTEDQELAKEIEELVASLPPPDPSDVVEPVVNERKRAGRPPKKFRGRMAREKQAIRDAEIAEKVAIKHRELPVLDLALKVIEDPSVELPNEAPIVFDNLAALDTSMLHEVGEVLKELVTKVSLNELRKPKREIKSRTRRCWEHLPERVPSRRQEYRALKVPVQERSPPPPPLKSKSRGRAYNKNQQIISANTALQYDGDTSLGSLDSEPTPAKVLNSFNSEYRESLMCLILKDFASSSSTTPQPAKAIPTPLQKVPQSNQSQKSPERLRTVPCVSYDDVNLNEEDLVDINVDTFFSSAENFDSSASGDETDTPSQNIRKKFREFLGEPDSSVPLSPTKVGHVSKVVEREKVIECDSGSVPNTSSATSSARFQQGQEKGEFNGSVEESAVRTTHHLSLEGDSFSLSAKPAEGLSQSSNVLNSSVDVCNKVETMLDVMELSLQSSEAVPASVDVDLDMNTLQEAFAGENLSSTQQFSKPFMGYHANRAAELIAGPLDIDELMLEIEAEFGDLNYTERVPCEYDSTAPQQFPPLNLQPVMREPIEYADTVCFEACRKEQHYCHSVTIAIPCTDACCLSLPAEVSVELVAPEKDERLTDDCHASITLPEYGCTTTKWQCSFHTAKKRFSRNAEHFEVSRTMRLVAQDKAVLSIADSESAFSPKVSDPTRNLSTENEFERDHLSAVKTIPLRMFESCSLSCTANNSTFKKPKIEEDVSQTVPCVNTDSTSLSAVAISCALVLTGHTEIISALLATKNSDSVDSHATCSSQKPSTSFERGISSTLGDSSDRLSTEEDIEWRNISRLKRIDLQKSYARLSPSDLALLKHDGVRLPVSGEEEGDTPTKDAKIIVKTDPEIASDVLEDLVNTINTTTRSFTEVVEPQKLCVIPPTTPSKGEKELALLRLETEISNVFNEPTEICKDASPRKAVLKIEPLEEISTEEAQKKLLEAPSPLAALHFDRKFTEESVLLDAEFLAAGSSSAATDFSVEHAITVSKELEKVSLKVLTPIRRKHRKRQQKRAGQKLTYLRSEDTLGSGFSEVTYLEQCYLQSPDLFGIGDGTRKRKRKSRVERSQRRATEDANREAESEVALIHSENSATRKYTLLQSDVKLALDRLWRRQEPRPCHGRFSALVELCRSKVMNLGIDPIRIDQGFLATEKIWSSLGRSWRDTTKMPYPRESTVAIIASRPRNHLISDFNLTMIKPINPIVRCEADMGPLLASLHPVSPLRLSRPRVEGSLENAFAQYDRGVKTFRSTTHWSLHFLMDAQLFILDILYELWEYTARSVQLAVFNTYQCSLWEKHHQVFDARMYCLLFEMNAAAALSSKIETCCSYIRRFEEWNRKTNNFSTVYNHVYGLALSLIKLVAIPNALKRLQAMTHWNSKARPSKSSEEIFLVDLIPFFQVGTCPFTPEGLDVEKLVDGKKSMVTQTLEHLLSFEAAQDNNLVDSFCFLFPSHSVVELCQVQIQKEVSAYYNKHLDDVLRLDHHHLSMLSPMARAYILSRNHEARAKSLMRNNIMNLDKLIAKLNIAFDELSTNVEEMNQAEFDYPCGQVVFDYEGGKVSVSINNVNAEDTRVPTPNLIEEARRLMGDTVKNTVGVLLSFIEWQARSVPENFVQVFHPIPQVNNELSLKRDRVQKSVDKVKNWVMTIPTTYEDDVDNDLECMDTSNEPMEVVYPSSPARITVIDDEDDDDDPAVHIPRKKRKGPQNDTVTTTIAGRKIQYSIDTERGVLKMKTMDSALNDASTDDLTATNTFTSASFSSFDQIETLKIIRSTDTGELNWLAMIENALEAAPPPETLPTFLQKSESLAYQTIDIMKAHEYANHFVRETNDDGEFLDLRKEQREKIRQFQLVDYFERRRNARFEAISSDKSLEMPRPGPGERDKIPLYALWLREVLQYAEIEKKRLTQLKPVNFVGRCRAARSEMIREFDVPTKRKKRSASSPPWLGRTIYDHFGEFFSLGMARLEYEVAGRNLREEGQLGAHDDTITHYFVSRNNSPSTVVDPLELLENPYAFFRPTPSKRKRAVSPLLESSLVKRVHLSDPPVFAPFATSMDEPETLYPPYCSDYDSSDEDD
ncbi:hypothetical protein OSTOST_00758 [Ostertagia ostertagi]